MNYKIGICHSDFYYAVSLMEFFNSHKEIPISVVVFSGINSVNEYLNEDFLHVLLVDEDNHMPVREELIIKKHVSVMTLCEERVTHKDNMKGIFKYQNVRSIGKQIILSIPKRLNTAGGETLFLGVYSPLGRCGKTTLAHGLCDYSGNSLYVGLEEFSGIYMEDQDNADNISRERIYTASCFMYYLADKNPDILDLLRSIKERSERKIEGIKSYMDIRQVNAEHMRWLKETVKGVGIFDVVVFDFGTGVLADFAILSHMDKLFIPVLQDKISKAKIKNFEEVIKEQNVDLTDKKIQYIHWMEKRLEDVDYESLFM